MKGAVQTALMQNTPLITNLHDTKMISLRNSDNYENEKTLKQKINFHNTDKLKEICNHKLIILLIFLKGSNLRLSF